jgi:hypothetical protein
VVWGCGLRKVATAVGAARFNVRQDSQPSVKFKTPKIIADGPERFRQSKSYQEDRAQLLAEAHQRYAEALDGASFVRRILITLQIEREVRAKLQQKFPPGALHVMDGKLNEPNHSPQPSTSELSLRLKSSCFGRRG